MEPQVSHLLLELIPSCVLAQIQANKNLLDPLLGIFNARISMIFVLEEERLVRAGVLKRDFAWVEYVTVLTAIMGQIVLKFIVQLVLFLIL